MGSAVAPHPVWRPIARVLLWDESGPARAMAQLITRSIPAADVEVAADPDDLLRRCGTDRPDIVFVGVRNRGESGVATIQRLHQVSPTTRIVACGTRVDTTPMSAAVGAGARGLLLLEPDGAAARVGQPPVERGRRAFQGSAVAIEVTERELQILRGMSDGHSNLEIAKQLFLSEDTVKTHARRLFRKLGAHDRAHAVALGMRHRLVT